MTVLLRVTNLRRSFFHALTKLKVWDAHAVDRREAFFEVQNFVRIFERLFRGRTLLMILVSGLLIFVGRSSNLNLRLVGRSADGFFAVT